MSKGRSALGLKIAAFFNVLAFALMTVILLLMQVSLLFLALAVRGGLLFNGGEHAQLFTLTIIGVTTVTLAIGLFDSLLRLARGNLLRSGSLFAVVASTLVNLLFTVTAALTAFKEVSNTLPPEHLAPLAVSLAATGIASLSTAFAILLLYQYRYKAL